MNDRDRGAPVALPRHQPVTKAIRDRGRAHAALLEVRRDGGDCITAAHSGEPARVDQHTFFAGGDLSSAWVRLTCAHHHPYRQPHGPGEIQVTLIMSWHGHD